MDLTVHQIRMPEGHLKELYKASGKLTAKEYRWSLQVYRQSSSEGREVERPSINAKGLQNEQLRDYFSGKLTAKGLQISRMRD